MQGLRDLRTRVRGWRSEPGLRSVLPEMSDTIVNVEVFDVPAQTACFSGG